MNKRVLAFITLLMLPVALVGCQKLTVTSKQVVGVVVETEYEAPKEKKVKTNKKDSKGQYIYEIKKTPEEYEVDITYEDLETEVKSKSLYYKVKEGDKIKVMLNEYRNEKGKIVDRNIEYNQ